MAFPLEFAPDPSKILARAGVDVSVILSSSSVKYYTGFIHSTYERPIVLVAGEKGSTLIAPLLEKERIEEVVGWNTIFYKDGDDPWILLADYILGSYGSGIRLGVEFTTPYSIVEKLKDLISPEALVDISGIIAEERSLKSPWMIERIRRAVRIIEKVYESIADIIKPGVSEREVSLHAIRVAEELGADSIVFAAVQSGPNSSIPHHERSGRKIRNGDVVVVDIALSYKGFYGDLTRCFFLEKPGENILESYRMVEEAVNRASEKAASGAFCSEIDFAARSYFESKGVGEHFIHRTGHGLGVEVHERPYISPNSKDVCKETMVFTIEPGLYFREKYGVRVERDVVIEGGKAVFLDTYEGELYIL